MQAITLPEQNKSNIVMRKILFFTLVTSLLSYQSFSQSIVETSFFHRNPGLGGDVVIGKSVKEVKGDKLLTTFEVNSPKAGNYYLSFWMIPAKLSSGEYACYSVEVNGEMLNDMIVPEKGNWQSITLSKNEMVALKVGSNIISIIGSPPEVPNVEYIRVSSSATKSVISSKAYDSYINEIKADGKKLLQASGDKEAFVLTDTTEAPVKNIPSYGSQSNPPYDHSYSKRVHIRYTFSTTVSFNQGQQIFLATNGVNSAGHILELFNYNDPEKYSWNATSNSNCLASMIVTIPKTGLYVVKIRSNRNAGKGLCNLNVNGQNYYENVPIFSIGIRCVQDTTKVYNTFTCQSTGNPVIWTEDGSALPGKMSFFNDDYTSAGDYNWGNDARIKRKYGKAVHGVILSESSSSTAESFCDIYAKCQNSDLYKSSFPKLKADDAIQSAPLSQTYNCIAWSGGIYTDWCWPPSNFSDYQVSDALSSFDAFYNSERYSGCKNTRELAPQKPTA